VSGSVSPSLGGFTNFVYGNMGITTAQLPTTSPAIPIAYSVALATVNVALSQTALAPIYALAVYNLAGDRLINYAADQPGQNFFQQMRQSLDITGFTAGVVSATADVSTSESLTVPAYAQTLTLSQLQNLKTFWGREYLGIAQTFGPMWGIS